MLLRHGSLLALLMVSLGSSVALAQTDSRPQPGSGSQNRMERGKQRWMSELNLTSEQRQKIEAIYNQNKAQIQQQRQALRQGMQELGDMMVGTATSDQIRVKQRQVAALQAQVMQAQSEQILAIRDVLTTEQRRKFAELMRGRRRRGGPDNRQPGNRQPSGSDNRQGLLR